MMEVGQGVGLVLIVTAALNPHLPAFSRKWRLVYPLNLNGEQNLAVRWSDIVSFAAGVLFYELYCRAADRLRPPCLQQRNPHRSKYVTKVCDCCVTIRYQRARFKYPVVRRFS